MQHRRHKVLWSKCGIGKRTNQKNTLRNKRNKSERELSFELKLSDRLNLFWFLQNVVKWKCEPLSLRGKRGNDSPWSGYRWSKFSHIYLERSCFEAFWWSTFNRLIKRNAFGTMFPDFFESIRLLEIALFRPSRIHDHCPPRMTMTIEDERPRHITFITFFNCKWSRTCFISCSWNYD